MASFGTYLQTSFNKLSTEEVESSFEKTQSYLSFIEGFGFIPERYLKPSDTLEFEILQ